MWRKSGCAFANWSVWTASLAAFLSEYYNWGECRITRMACALARDFGQVSVDCLLLDRGAIWSPVSASCALPCVVPAVAACFCRTEFDACSIARLFVSFLLRNLHSTFVLVAALRTQCCVCALVLQAFRAICCAGAPALICDSVRAKFPSRISTCEFCAIPLRLCSWRAVFGSTLTRMNRHLLSLALRCTSVIILKNWHAKDRSQSDKSVRCPNNPF